VDARLAYLFSATTVVCALLAGIAFSQLSSLRATLSEREATIAALSSRLAKNGDLSPTRGKAPGLLASKNRELDPGTLQTSPGPSAIAGIGLGDATSRSSEKNVSSATVEELRMVQENGQLDQKLGRLFNRWALPPEQLKRVKAMLAERQLTLTDAMSTAREQGIDSSNPDTRTSMNELLSKIREEYNGRVRHLIGPDKYEDLKSYEQAEPERNTATALLLRLSPTAAPLRNDQFDQLVTVLAESAAGSRLLQVQNGIVSAGISDEAVRRAKAFLNQEQFDVLLTMQREQQARSALAKIKRPGTADGKPAVAGSVLPPKS